MKMATTDTGLFVCRISSHSRIVKLFGEILTHAHHFWPFSCEGSLACKTYCDTWHPFIHSHLLPHPIAFGSGAVTTCLTTQVCRGWIRTPNLSACEATGLTDSASPAAKLKILYHNKCNGEGI